MKFGHFDDERREYVIDTPKTPLPWINYLGSEDFFSLISRVRRSISQASPRGTKTSCVAAMPFFSPSKME